MFNKFKKVHRESDTPATAVKDYRFREPKREYIDPVPIYKRITDSNLEFLANINADDRLPDYRDALICETFNVLISEAEISYLERLNQWATIKHSAEAQRTAVIKKLELLRKLKKNTTKGDFTHD